MKAEYRLTIGERPEGSDRKPRKMGKLATVKAAMLALLVLSVVIGVFLAAAVLGSIIATALVVLVGISVVAWSIRRIVRLIKTYSRTS
jgi:hypothetical protein